jgi:hypothetical protein
MTTAARERLATARGQIAIDVAPPGARTNKVVTTSSVMSRSVSPVMPWAAASSIGTSMVGHQRAHR